MTFADGSTETLCRFIDVLQEGGGVPRPYAGPRVVRGPSDPERVRRVAEARARRELRWAVASIEADRMLTLTFGPNVQDRKVALASWSRFIRLMKARYPSWKYVAVMELQQRGAIHFHVAVRGFQPINYIRSVWRVASAENYGQPHIGKPHSSGRVGLAAYLGKYLSKAFGWIPKFARRFFASKDRERPVIDRWWINYVTDDGRVIETVYRATCGARAVGCRQWLSPDGAAYVVSCEGPPGRDPVPF